MIKAKDRFQRRKQRTRVLLKKRSYNKLRLSIYRSGRHMYAQLIDDILGHTIVSASTIEKEVRDSLKNTSDKEAAFLVGERIAKRAMQTLKPNQLNIVFDRGGYLYHGKVKAVADAARENGLKF